MQNKIAALLFIGLFTLNGFADEYQNSQGQEDVALQESASRDEVLVIVATRSPRPIQDIVSTVTLIDREQMDNQIVGDLEQLFRHQPGISPRRNSTRFNVEDISVRGIGGNRVSMLIDGIPLGQQFDIGSYANAGRDWLNPDVLQRVEILHGPASTLYGSDAIGGVIAFYTRDPDDLLALGDNDSYMGLNTTFSSVDNSRRAGVTGAWGNQENGLLLMANWQEREQPDNQATFEPGPNQLQEQQQDLQDSDAQNILAKWVWDFSVNERLKLTLDKQKSDSISEINSVLGNGRFRNTLALAGDDQQTRSRSSLELTSSSENFLFDSTILRLYQQKSKTNNFTSEQRNSRGVLKNINRWFFYDQTQQGVSANFQKHLTGELYHQRLGFGIEWRKTDSEELRDAIETNLATNTQTNILLSEVFPLRDFPITKTDELAVYLHDEIEFDAIQLTVIPAIRYDRYKLKPRVDSVYLEDFPDTEVVSIEKGKWSPKLGMLYDVFENNKLYFQYAHGFRSPPFEDVNIGLHIPLFNIRAIPNPDLKPEQSKSVELGWRYFGSSTQWTLALFHNNYQDFIETKVNLGPDPVSGEIIFQSRNIDKAIIYGLEASLQHEFEQLTSGFGSLSFNTGLMVSKGNNEQTNEPLNSIEPGELVLGLNWLNADEDWRATFNVRHVMDKNNDEVDWTGSIMPKLTQSFTLIDLTTAYHMNNNLKIKMGIFNLTDKKYWNWASINGLDESDPMLELLSSPGRYYSISLDAYW